MAKNKKDVITFKGDRSTWIEFTHKIKKERKIIWTVLKKLIEKYMKGDEKWQNHTIEY